MRFPLSLFCTVQVLYCMALTTTLHNTLQLVTPHDCHRHIPWDVGGANVASEMEMESIIIANNIWTGAPI